ncbi:MAG TPA: hypothetical protein VE223_05140 [Nitrososphaeraceae archaeon]|nr:hypothetical protein [Nitrososphaeraceae archaeon]
MPVNNEMVENRIPISLREFLDLMVAVDTISLFGGLGFSRLLRSASGFNITNPTSNSASTNHFAQQLQQQ